ncbi:putative 26S proteasome non-ATPase regulatory subunit 3 [Hibiscus syriacus]|uniref:26S proteasome non-ATPase regulatory subunit 3 n=1 Tax=Hibiscus syriacus TaxID=106335 RepID=A0A6A3BEJ2_HIBSY|nr:putative 26S proteasome non-ATPase regulatory subunit 3 [Hibiscus syriacus]
MTQDVEMKEQQLLTISLLHLLHPLCTEIASLIEIDAYDCEARRILRAIRLTMALRRKLKPSMLSSFLTFTLSLGSEALTRLSSYLPKENEHEMEVDTATSVAQPPTKLSLLELEIYCYLLFLIFLIDQQKYDEAKACSYANIAWLKNLNRRTLDILAARLCFYYSLCYELTGTLAEIRRTIQLEYADAKECLLQASRKAHVTALGFRVQCNKWAIIVRLLLGEIPERIVFMQKGMEKALRPYFELTIRHWVLAVIDIKATSCYYLDSLGPTNANQQLKQIIDVAMILYTAQSGSNKRVSLNWINVLCPRQSGGTKCGYYVCKFMKEIVENGLEVLVNKNSIRHKREKVTWQKIIWLPLHVPKLSIVSWMPILERLPTKDRLAQMLVVFGTKLCRIASCLVG